MPEFRPSRRSLREIPEIDFATATWSPNPFAERIAAEGIQVRVGRGRVRKGQESGETVVRSVRFPKRDWERIERAAKKRGLTLHAALRVAAAEWETRSRAEQ